MGKLTRLLGVESSQYLYEDLLKDSTSYYVYVARPDAWPFDSNPPVIEDTVDEEELSTYTKMLYAQRVSSDDVRYMTRRIDWVTGTVYDQYDPEVADLESQDYYVLTIDNNVYKCLYNNLGAQSTVKPFIIDYARPFTTSDGYVWRYMYSITPEERTKFATSTWMPVVPDANTVASAIPGSIDAFIIENPGAGYDTFHEGFVRSLVNTSTITLETTASSNTGFYVGSSIYLRNGQGAGQIREITSYNASTKQIVVDEAFDVFTSLRLADISGSFLENYAVFQVSSTFPFSAQSKDFYSGESVVQVDVGANGTVIAANTTSLTVVRDASINFVSDKPFVNLTYAPVARAGTVTITAGANTVTGVGTSLSTHYPVGSYIQVGANTARNVRRVTVADSATSLQVDSNFDYAASANVHYTVEAGEANTKTDTVANGFISFADDSSVLLRYSGATGVFALGERLIQTSISTANGIIAFANSTALKLTEVLGTFANTATISGLTTSVNATISAVVLEPNITVGNVTGTFLPQIPVLATSDTSGAIPAPGVGVASADVTGVSVIPNDLTSYYISPTVEIQGDGVGARAYSVVGGVSNSISKIELLRAGNGYSSANAIIRANTFYGVDADVRAVISPPGGHGADAVTELNADAISISVAFSNSFSEGYKHIAPSQFRRVGIIKDPELQNVMLTIANNESYRLQCSNVAGTFRVGEVVRQGDGFVGIVDAANATHLVVSGVSSTTFGLIDTGAVGDSITGSFSGATSNVSGVVTLQTNAFSIGERFTQEVTGATGIVKSVTGSNVVLTNVVGSFTTNLRVTDLTHGGKSNVTAISLLSTYNAVTSNNYDISVSQTCRLTLTSNATPFTVGEQIIQYDVNENQLASGQIFDHTNDIDIVFSSSNGTFFLGQSMSQGSANGIVLFANSTYMKLTAVQGTFTTGTNMVGTPNGTVGNVDAIYRVINIVDVSGDFVSGNTLNQIRGQTSNTTGLNSIANTVTLPDFVKNTGKNLYIENIQPVNVTLSSTETVRITLQY